MTGNVHGSTSFQVTALSNGWSVTRGRWSIVWGSAAYPTKPPSRFFVGDSSERRVRRYVTGSTERLIIVILNPSASLRINSSEEPGGVGLPMTGAAEPATTVTFIRPVRIADITLLTTNGIQDRSP